MLTLFHAPGTCSLASLITLEYAGADYTVHKVDFSANEQRSPAFLALNPNGRVPALQCARGVLTETPAILLYLAQTYPAAALAPLEDPFALAQVQAFNSYLCSTLHVAHAHRVRGSRWADDPVAIEAMRRKVPESVGACFALVEAHLPAAGWVSGAQAGISDFYLFTVAQWLEGDGLDPAAYPKVIAHRERVRALPAVQKALAV
ncbi:glutathione S-transferase family protein [Uliginosibacterium sp. 31-12]|uniref:glutathione S-transferase family protein n=1 Tax=Uliginosibacterium sp. 31-12 TaxID=3062781 RepID=UPI0026E43D1A|nr:glutathione S-transferase family protein [Uliginosibacterium sp. 31-12]MDO6387739.1 glutathione S-transferase family protein [Uliginosibacterium sp. 31-12]